MEASPPGDISIKAVVNECSVRYASLSGHLLPDLSYPVRVVLVSSPPIIRGHHRKIPPFPDLFFTSSILYKKQSIFRK